MIIIIDIGEDRSFHYVKFRDDSSHVTLDGTFHVVGKFEVVKRDDDGDPSIIRDVATEYELDPMKAEDAVGWQEE